MSPHCSSLLIGCCSPFSAPLAHLQPISSPLTASTPSDALLLSALLASFVTNLHCTLRQHFDISRNICYEQADKINKFARSLMFKMWDFFCYIVSPFFSTNNCCSSPWLRLSVFCTSGPSSASRRLIDCFLLILLLIFFTCSEFLPTNFVSSLHYILR